MESCAIGVYWKSLGDAMDISFDGLRCSSRGDGRGWADGLGFLDDLHDWGVRYGRENMRAASSNRVVAEMIVEHRLESVLAMFRKPVRNLVASLLEDRLRFPGYLPLCLQSLHAIES